MPCSAPSQQPRILSPSWGRDSEGPVSSGGTRVLAFLAKGRGQDPAPPQWGLRALNAPRRWQSTVSCSVSSFCGVGHKLGVHGRCSRRGQLPRSTGSQTQAPRGSRPLPPPETTRGGLSPRPPPLTGCLRGPFPWSSGLPPHKASPLQPLPRCQAASVTGPHLCPSSPQWSRTLCLQLDQRAAAARVARRDSPCYP